jgi:hypothetical protein
MGAGSSEEIPELTGVERTTRKLQIAEVEAAANEPESGEEDDPSN